MKCIGGMAMLSERYYLPIKIIRGEKNKSIIRQLSHDINGLSEIFLDYILDVFHD
jgi:hypothetical protein